ncbi:hypothetical protein [Cyanobium gracile]|uniref:Uncharacterized protein n=1 Tax=Cyanobium gracile UHCC 0281 TaxID=3110309 RepID=A0ABU5SZ91_9CYAN|nr:hypothetical protein [Cyanobium gracile]MEA5443842.1 hypothetical protein [Cyanobium gracile UHCC 0281]
MSDPTTPPWTCVRDGAHACTIWQRGCHEQGNYLRVYVPDAAARAEQPLRAVLYLHGFALCMPSFYESHLLALAAEGYIVFFPDFQQSDYPSPAPGDPVPAWQEVPRAGPWTDTALRLAGRPAQASVGPEVLHPTLAARYGGGRRLAGAVEPPTVGDLRRVVFPLLLIELILGVIGWFRRTYARNLSHLLWTVAMSLASPPKAWLAQALALVEAGWDDLARERAYAHWRQAQPMVYGFGHSLGGLLSLSLPWALRHEPDARFRPRVIVVADPAAESEMGIPRFAIWLLRLFGAPFSADPLRIRQTGPQLCQPVAILHGADDDLVPPAQWVGPTDGGGTNFSAIHSKAKAIYFSCSNPDGKPPLKAFHNQAVTCTRFYDDALFEFFGGVKHGANAYNTAYIWPGALALFGEQVQPADLLGALPDRPFAITTGEPPPPDAAGSHSDGAPPPGAGGSRPRDPSR